MKKMIVCVGEVPDKGRQINLQMYNIRSKAARPAREYFYSPCSGKYFLADIL